MTLALIGLLAGLVGGMLGVGGSIVMIPAMTEVLGPNQHVYQAAAMIVNFFVVVPAAVQHRRAKAIDRSAVARMIPLMVIAVVIGVALSELPLFLGPGEAYLRGLFGLFLLLVAGADLYRVFSQSRLQKGNRANAPVPKTRSAEPGWIPAAAVGVPTGLIAGLLGIGGGMLAVPLQRRFLHAPMRTSIGNSATMIVATSAIGAIVKNYALMTAHGESFRSLRLAAVLVPTAIMGSLVGSRLTHRLPVRAIRGAFFVLLLLAAVRLTYGAFLSLSQLT